jgi:hypothetical protein
MTKARVPLNLTSLILAILAILVPHAASAASDSPDHGAPGVMRQFEGPVAGGRSWDVAGYRLTYRVEGSTHEATPVLTVVAPDGVKIEARALKDPSFFASASVGVGRVDPSAPGLQVILSAFTGGAHCCDEIKLLEMHDGAWRVIEVGVWDGEPLHRFPIDVNGDGRPDFVMADNRFLYAFDCYACSGAPPQIIDVVDGKVVDVSTSPSFKPVFRRDYLAMKKDCAKHQNSACAAMVADAARLGVFAEGWAFMLAHFERNADWDYPARCRRPGPKGACPKGEEIKPADYPQALRWFLEDNGYLPRRAGRPG